MLTIKSDPTYSVTIAVNVDGQHRTATVCELSATDVEQLNRFLDENTLNSFLDYRFRRHFCEALVDIPLRQAQDAQLLKEHIACSFIPGYPDEEPIEIDDDFNDVFLSTVDYLKERGLIKVYYDFNSDNLRMIEPTRVGQALIHILFGR